MPQRKKDIAKAKQLMAAAGHAKGFPITLTTETTGEIPELAQIVKQSVKAIGIDMTLTILTSTAYFAGSRPGRRRAGATRRGSNGPINITDWGRRAVPNVYLISALGTKGVWNAAHYSNKQFDSAVKSFLGSASAKDQNKYAVIMQKILLHDTPDIFPYFYFYTAAGSKSVKGYKADALGQVYLSKTSLG